MVIIVRAFLLAGLSALGLSQANAVCPIGVPPPTRYVGNVATDNQCTDNDIQSAIDSVACPGAKIVITGEHTYTAQHLILSNKSLLMIGSSGVCGDPGGTGGGGGGIPTAPLVTIKGTGQTGASVVTINGSSNVTLQYLEITGGNKTNSGSEGGGIFFGGAGSLTLDTDTIDGNQADYGGGIDVSPTGATTLRLLANNYIISNTARTSGGGIRLEGDTHLIAVSDQTLIGFNTAASGYGGGMEVIGPARADIGSPGFGFGSGGVISNNTAAYGGGVAVIANQDGNNDAVVQLFTTDPERPVSLQDNNATVEGGGVYAKPFAGSQGTASSAAFCAFDFRMDGNTAPEGAALYLDYDTAILGSDNGSTAVLNYVPPAGGASDCGAPPSLFGGVACAADAPCNELSGNKAQDVDGTATDGAVVFITNDSTQLASHLTVHGNTAAHAIHGNGADMNYAVGAFNSSLIANNVFSQAPFLLEKAGLYLESCTVAQNAILAAHVFKLDSAFLAMHDSIIGEHGPLALQQSGDNNLTIDNVMSNDISTLPVSSTIINQDPMFVDPAHGDFHLQAYLQNGHLTASRAIDFAAPAPVDLPDDLDGHPYGQDVQAVPDFHGTRDLGAYEMRPINDRIFGDAFGDPLSLVH